MQVKTTIGYHYIPIAIVKIKGLTTPSVDKAVAEGEFL